MNAVIDIGNTRTKIAWFEVDEMIAIDITDNRDRIVSLLSSKRVSYSIVSSVADDELTNFVKCHLREPILLKETTAIPIKNSYKTLSTLGKDRLANAVGAYRLFNHSNTLIIDAGTCLKFDFIDASNSYLGGSISPGLQMRYNAVHTFTDKLPLVYPEQQAGIMMGNDTISSINAGCYMGMNNEIERTIDSYRSKFDQLNIILTGGDMEELQKMGFSQKNSIFADRWLTLRGLNEILRYNVES